MGQCWCCTGEPTFEPARRLLASDFPGRPLVACSFPESAGQTKIPLCHGLGAFRQTFLPILKICKGASCRLCFRKSNRILARIWTQDLEVWNTAQIFNGHESRAKGTHDSVLCPLLPQPLQTKSNNSQRSSDGRGTRLEMLISIIKLYFIFPIHIYHFQMELPR